MTTLADHPLTMTISLSVLDHLGLNLYSNIPAVLSEAVANAWDADATVVDIDIDAQRQLITVVDDGMGMTRQELNDRFLAVGYRRREHEPIVTGRQRHVMGRKGIGKLAMFSIADTIEVRSQRKTDPGTAKPAPSGLCMNKQAIQQQIEKGKGGGEGDYHPDEIDPATITLPHPHGTMITLTDLTIQPTTNTVTSLRKRLARRFSIIGPDNQFLVKVNGDEIGVQDRDYFDKIEYLWSIGDVGNRYELLCTKAAHREGITGTVDAAAHFEVTGWVGTFDERKSIEEDNNAISILAWGKLVQEDVLKDAKAGGLYTKYAIGEIRADFLDQDDRADIATSDRQRVKGNDPRYQKLLEYIRTIVVSVHG